MGADDRFSILFTISETQEEDDFFFDPILDNAKWYDYLIFVLIITILFSTFSVFSMTSSRRPDFSPSPMALKIEEFYKGMVEHHCNKYECTITADDLEMMNLIMYGSNYKWPHNCNTEKCNEYKNINILKLGILKTFNSRELNLIQRRQDFLETCKIKVEELIQNGKSVFE